MLGIDPEIGTAALRLWIAAGSAAVLVVVCALAFVWSRTGLVTSGGNTVLVVLGAVLGASMTWAFLDSATVLDHSAERQALEMRAEQLSAQARAPGSPLACLDTLAGQTIAAACEKAVFAAPATVATAISYVAARFALLADMAAYTRGGGADIDNALLPLRRSLEADPFGLLAHVLALRDGCTGQNCKALALLHDPSRVRTNLIAKTLDHYLEHYREAWAESPDVPVAEATEAQPTSTAQLNAAGQRKVTVDIDFPTASSIPPISIMNPEPKSPVVPGVATGAAANTNAAMPAASPGRRSGKHVTEPPAQDGARGAAPSPAAEAAQPDPVWTPAPPPAVPQAAARSAPPSANLAPAGAAPVQLDPFASPPKASTDVTMRAQ
jgi:hypothetical protein